MINRILIRMKVVQMLYSYLLTRSEFRILPVPESQSRDKRFAYSLYCDLLLLILDISDYQISNDEGRPRILPLNRKDSVAWRRVAQSLADNDDMKNIVTGNRSFIEALVSHRLRIKAAIDNSSVIKDFSRKAKKAKPEVEDEVQLLRVVLETIVLRDKGIDDLIHANPDFTHVGYEQALEMLDETLSDYSTTRSSLVDARRGLMSSFDKAYELYHSLLQLMCDITRLREIQLDEAKHKYLPTSDDLNPNMRFVENQFIASLRDCPAMKAYLEENPISWEGDEIAVRCILERIMESDIYQQYMNAPMTDYAADCDLWQNLFKSIIVENDDLTEALESKSVYWNDDLNIMGSFVLKTIKRFARENGNVSDLLPKFKDDEDAAFGPGLFEATIKNQEEYRAMIDACLVGSQWDPERLAFMDIVILETAIAEILNFPSIPTLVSINEYTEIANYYSTPKSGQFITGMLYAIINNLKKEGKLIKE